MKLTNAISCPFRKRLCRALVFGVACLLLASGKLSAFELNRTFSNDMVLQRDKPVNVWGTAEKGETVTVTFASQTKSAKPDESGRWVVTLAPVSASSKGQEMVISSSIRNQKSVIRNLLVGDVFLFARQSSIDVSLGATPEGKQAAARINPDTNLRVIRIQTTPSLEPLNNLKPDATSGWGAVNAESALSMSAVAVYLGRDLVKEVDVPIGLIDLDMAYYFAPAWLSAKGFDAVISTGKAHDLEQEKLNLATKMAEWDKEKVGIPPIEVPYAPGVCYNSTIHPLQGIGLKGIVLQLGNDYPYIATSELYAADDHKVGNISRKPKGDFYSVVKLGIESSIHALPTTVDDLRVALGDVALPLAWIAPPGSDVETYTMFMQDMRELQRRTAMKSQAVDMILPGEAHIPFSCQPKDDTLLAARCKQWVMGAFYGVKTPKTGPVFERMEAQDNAAIIHFKSGTGDGLSAKGNALELFELAGEDGTFVSCKAEITGQTIKLTSDTVSKPMFVRYGWTGMPEQGLVNSAGLPAVGFTTEANWECAFLPPKWPKEEQPEERHPGVATEFKKSDGSFPWHGPYMKAATFLTKDGNKHHWHEHDEPFPNEEMTRWRTTTIESVKNASEGWYKPDFDDSQWDEVILPHSWIPSHVGLFRTSIDVDDPGALKNLLARVFAYKTKTLKVYLNGEVVVNITSFPSKSIEGRVVLTEYARNLVKKGKNHIAVVAENSTMTASLGFRLVEFSKMLEVSPEEAKGRKPKGKGKKGTDDEE